MLTREEAKTKECPYKTQNDIDVNRGKLLRSNLIPEEIEKRSLAFSKCKAEDCPKWRDGQEEHTWCEHIEIEEWEKEFLLMMYDKKCLVLQSLNECTTNEPELDQWRFSSFSDLKSNYKCNKCSHRYGYCGG